VVVSPDGTRAYVANNQEGTVSVLSLTPQNPPTVANPVLDQNATEDALFTYTVPANTFTDVDNADTLTYTTGARPNWLGFDATTRTFTGTPTNADVGTLTITVTATDGDGGTASDTFTLTVTNTNDAPTVANPIADQSASEDTPFTYTVPANTFTDIDNGASLTYTTGTLPNWLTFDASTRTFTGTPTNTHVGAVSITVTATDESGQTATDTFTLAVTNADDAPVAANDAVTTAEGTAVVINVLANDTDPDGDTLSPTVVSPPARGGVIRNADGSFTYTPEANFNGTDTFTYTASDGTTASAPVTVTITITAVDDPGKVPLVVPGQLDSVVYSGDGSRAFVFTEQRNGQGRVLSTSIGIIDTATGTAVTSPLTISGRFVSAEFNPTSPRVGFISSSEVLNSQGRLTTTLTTINPTTGAVINTLVLDGRLNSVQYSQNGSRAYLITDTSTAGVQRFTVATVDTVTGLTPNQAAPLTFDGELHALVLNPNQTRALINYSDGPDSHLAILNTSTATQVGSTATLPGQFPSGIDAIILSADSSRASFITEAANQTTKVTTYQLNNGVVDSNRTLTINGWPRVVQYNPDRSLAFVIAETPESLGDPTSTSVGIVITATGGSPSLPFTLTGEFDSLVFGGNSRALLTYTDSAGISHVAIINTTTTSSPVTRTIDLTGQPTGTTILSNNGITAVIITTTANDTTALTTIDLSKNSVKPANDAPAAVDDTFITAHDSAFTGNVLTNDTDVDGDTLTPTIVSPPTRGTVVFNAYGSFTYTPDDTFIGTDAFTYRVSDGTAISAPATVTITVNPAGF
jgi:hypothetical protein